MCTCCHQVLVTDLLCVRLVLIALSLLRLSRAFEVILTMTGLNANALLDNKIARCKDLILIKEELTALGLDASGVVAALARIFEVYSISFCFS